MSFANVFVGNVAGDGSGDPLRLAFSKINQNFANIAAGQVTVNAPVLSVAGRTGNVVLTVNDILGAFNSSNIAGNLSIRSLTASGDTPTGYNGLFVGASGYTVVPNLLAQHTGNYNSYSQVNSQNIMSGNQSTTDYIATANNGTNTTNYIDMGIAGGAYDGTVPNNSLGTSLYPNDGYVYVQGSTQGVVGGNLVLGTTVPGTGIRFLAGGINYSNIAVAINNPGTNPTNNSTGALVVTGGVGISGNINVGQYNTSLHNIRGNVLLGLGNVVASADTILTINQNSATPYFAPNNIVHLSATDGRNAQYGADSYGAGANSGIYFRKARGTSSSPNALQTNDVLGFVAARGYGTSGISPETTTSASSITFVATENFTDTSQGTSVLIRTNSHGTNSAVTTVTIANDITDFRSNLIYVRGNLIVVGNSNSIGFTMANVLQWTNPVYTMQDALNQLAARLTNAGY
jgi:hypothetical protein